MAAGLGASTNFAQLAQSAITRENDDVVTKKFVAKCCGLIKSSEPIVTYRQHLCVVRHAHRLDHNYEEWMKSDWRKTHPYDTPLTQEGLNRGEKVGKMLKEWCFENRLPFRIVITSPYWRCVQTAIPIAKELGLPIFLDREFGEVFDTTYMPECNGSRQYHTDQQIAEEIERHGVKCVKKGAGPNVVGMDPAFPESFEDGCLRFVIRFEQNALYAVKRLQNCIIVTHADAVASILAMVKPDSEVQSVDYGAFFIANRDIDVTKQIKESEDEKQEQKQRRQSRRQSVSDTLVKWFVDVDGKMGQEQADLSVYEGWTWNFPIVDGVKFIEGLVMDNTDTESALAQNRKVRPSFDARGNNRLWTMNNIGPQRGSSGELKRSNSGKSPKEGTGKKGTMNTISEADLADLQSKFASMVQSEAEESDDEPVRPVIDAETAAAEQARRGDRLKSRAAQLISEKHKKFHRVGHDALPHMQSPGSSGVLNSPGALGKDQVGAFKPEKKGARAAAAAAQVDKDDHERC